MISYVSTPFHINTNWNKTCTYQQKDSIPSPSCQNILFNRWYLERCW